MAYLKSKALKLSACSSIALMLAGCVNQPGFGARDAEWSRLRGQSGPFNVVSINHERAVVSARGRQVAIEAAEGFCVAKESIETTGRSAFAMIGDCVLDDPTAANRAAAKSLPHGVPGIITVSISGDRGYTRDGNGAGSLSDLNAFLKTSEGRKMLGRGGAGQSVSIRESRTIDSGLYVLVEDKNTDVIPILAPRFWRSFVDLNDRLTVVTISGFKDKPLGSDEMLKYLVNQVKTLAYANREPLNEARTYVVEADTSRQDTPNAVVALADIRPEPLTVTAETVREDVFWPLPPGRPDVPEDAADSSAEGPDSDIVEAPEDGDPSVALEIAAATDGIPVPTPRAGQATDVSDATSENEQSDAPEVAAASDAADEPDSAPDAGANSAEVADAGQDAGSTVAEADVQSSAADASSSEPDAAASTNVTENAAAVGDIAPTDQQDVATTDQASAPEADTAPTANAPTNAPQAPRRPQRG